MIIKTYQVARHLFRLELPVDKPTGEKILKAYAPFETQTEEPPLFTLHLHLCQELPVPPQEQLLKHFDQELPFLWAFQSNIGYTFGFSLTPGKPEALVCDTVQPTEKTLYLCETSTPEQLTFGLHNALMLTFTRQTAPLDTLLIHSSVICKDQQGYAFLGKSGTGKSTHSRLWLQYIPGSELLNDDNPVIRICHGTPVIFGSPWSGKTPCYKNKEVPLESHCPALTSSSQPHHPPDRQQSIRQSASLLFLRQMGLFNHRLHSSHLGASCHTLQVLSPAVPSRPGSCCAVCPNPANPLTQKSLSDADYRTGLLLFFLHATRNGFIQSFFNNTFWIASFRFFFGKAPCAICGVPVIGTNSSEGTLRIPNRAASSSSSSTFTL